jgi:hypothetical protein
MKNGALAWIAAAIVAFAASESRGQYPPARWSPWLGSPKPEDYFRREQFQFMRSLGVPCGMGLFTYQPPTIVYYNEAPCGPCGEPVHRSFQGTYGVFHPQPYYIPNRLPTIGFPDGRPPAGGIFYPQATRAVLPTSPDGTFVPNAR